MPWHEASAAGSDLRLAIYLKPRFTNSRFRRACDRILKVAQTIAGLNAGETIQLHHIAEAVNYSSKAIRVIYSEGGEYYEYRLYGYLPMASRQALWTLEEIQRS